MPINSVIVVTYPPSAKFALGEPVGSVIEVAGAYRASTTVVDQVRRQLIT
jgi:hypothetical protein